MFAQIYKLIYSVVLGLMVTTMVLFAQPSEIRIYWLPVHGGPGGDYFLSATEVTFNQYDQFCDKTGYKKPDDVWGRGMQPVVNISVADAQAYCKWLSKETGSEVRLPTRDEWEFAAKGGIDGDHYVFSGSGNPKDVAWFDENSDEDEYIEDEDLPEKRAHVVATKQPNLLGFYDMSGNVWEWIEGVNVAMGGSYKSIGQDCFPSSISSEFDPGFSAINVGFRVLMKKKI